MQSPGYAFHYVRDVTAGTSQDWDFTAVAHVSHKAQNSERLPEGSKGQLQFISSGNGKMNWKKESAELLKDQRTARAPGMEMLLRAWAKYPQLLKDLVSSDTTATVTVFPTSTAVHTGKFSGYSKKEGALSKPALAPNAAGWKLVPGSVSWFPGGNVLPCPCPWHISSRACPPPQGKTSGKSPFFFSCLLGFNPAWVWWTCWLTRAPRGLLWRSSLMLEKHKPASSADIPT